MSYAKGSPRRLACPHCKSKLLNEDTLLMHMRKAHPTEWAAESGQLPMDQRTARAYVRVSTTDQDVALQKAKISSFLNLKGVLPHNIRWYEDPGVSGTLLERPGIMALLADLQRGDLFVMTHPSRLSRKLRDFITLTSAVKNLKGEIYCVDFPCDTSDVLGNLQWKWLGLMAEFEWFQIVDRAMDGVEARKKKGGTMGRHRDGCGITHPCPTGRHGSPISKKPAQAELGLTPESPISPTGV